MNLDLGFNPDVVKDFALDVWHDLKETGLAAVAVALAITFVAVSAIVLKPGGPPEVNTGYAAADAAATQDVALTLPEDEPMKLADIDPSEPRDPFRTLDQLESGDDGSQSAQSVEDLTVASESESGGGGSSGSSDSSTSTSVSYDDSEELVPLDDLQTAESDPPDSSEKTSSDGEQWSGDAQGELDTGDSNDDDPEVSDYAYTADVQFGVEGSLKRYASVQRLEFVPSRSNPLLMFLGVKADHETAVFMVDSRLSQGGEGKCVPKPSLCTFVEMSADASRDEHRFRDADGEEYLLRMRGVSRAAASASVSDSSAPVLVDGSR